MNPPRPAILFIFGGLPGVGKSALARHLARSAGAAYLRIDTIEQAMRDQEQPIRGPEGYVVAYRLAGDNLRLGHSVVADSVNPLEVTRRAWRDVASGSGALCCEIEVVCSDTSVHRQRVESRSAEVPGLQLPTWPEVVARPYESWHNPAIRIDTAGQAPADSRWALDAAVARWMNTSL